MSLVLEIKLSYLILNICHDYCELHDLTFNAKKSMCMYFSIAMNKHCGLPVIYLGNSVCQFVKEVKYLGVIPCQITQKK